MLRELERLHGRSNENCGETAAQAGGTSGTIGDELRGGNAFLPRVELGAGEVVKGAGEVVKGRALFRLDLNQTLSLLHPPLEEEGRARPSALREAARGAG